ncbi:hypothetical protein F0562_017756 [Nyssa sinensis]|uniref:Uncharacterized protein n=1 Tax=Nyssa sinensis TaxID=561372 RepID=A0A5J4ZFM6_9ASTE|nr:hypothetical protein F0562_017756 [Nyssa sinensis]
MTNKQRIVAGPGIIKCGFRGLLVLIIVVLVTAVINQTKENRRLSDDQLAQNTPANRLCTCENPESSIQTSKDPGKQLPTYKNPETSLLSTNINPGNQQPTDKNPQTSLLPTHMNPQTSFMSTPKDPGNQLPTHNNPQTSLSTPPGLGKQLRHNIPETSLSTPPSLGKLSTHKIHETSSSTLPTLEKLWTHRIPETSFSTPRNAGNSMLVRKNGGNSMSRCDLFSGKWVYDNKSYPLYKDRQCPYMFGDLACEMYGRKDLKYQSWRWQPRDCDLPRFNGKALLERLRDKRLVFVGDSVNRNQWVSMICLVESSIPQGFKSMRARGSLYTFKATEYNASIDFYWAPFLVESNADNPHNHRLTDRIVRIQAIEKHAKYWTDADIIVFNSYLWWRLPGLKLLLGSFEKPNKIYKERNQRLYKMALNTWSDWLDSHVNRTKTRLFFVSMSATHSRAREWGMPMYQNCLNETEPISKEGYWGSGSDPNMMRLLKGEIRNLKRRGLKVQMLNITQLSEYRKDGHPSIYRKQWVPLTKEKLADPLSYADCTHWCLPGVPDVWNELLYAYIV